MRPPQERQALSDLSYVLGQSHAVRQTCRGPRDNYWRSRMAALLKMESAEAALRARLSRAFNAGFMADRAAFPSCTVRARAEAAQLARRGAGLAAALADPRDGH